jgi:uncharacterized cupredoxin-like copper-binding protein
LVAFAACGSPAHHSGTMTSAPAGGPRSQTFGRSAVAAEATRTVEVQLSDDLRFRPAEIRVKPGEIVDFHLVNGGKVVHEFTIGGTDSQELHEDQMALMDMSGTGSDTAMGGMAMGGTSPMAGMKMDKMHRKYLDRLKSRVAELNRKASASDGVHVPPGESRDLVWAFTGPSAPLFGCHIPVHWSAGMKGSFVLS